MGYFYLDLDRVCFDKIITHKKRIKNLSQLNASLPYYITYTDRLGFYPNVRRHKEARQQRQTNVTGNYSHKLTTKTCMDSKNTDSINF